MWAGSFVMQKSKVPDEQEVLAERKRAVLSSDAPLFIISLPSFFNLSGRKPQGS